MRKATALKPRREPELTSDELKRVTEKLAVALEHDTEQISLVTLLFTHLETVARHNPRQLEFAFYEIRQTLFVGTTEADEAQRQFQANAFKNRGVLLMWPNKRSAK